MTFSI